MAKVQSVRIVECMAMAIRIAAVRMRILFAVLALLPAGVGVAPADAQDARPANSSAAPEAQWHKAVRLADEQKYDDAVIAAKKVLRERQTEFGEKSVEASEVIEFIAEALELVERYDEALANRRQVLAIVSKLYGADDWRVTDARLAVADLEAARKLSPNNLRRVREAVALDARVDKLYDQQKYAEAITAAKKLLELWRAVVGEHHAYVATTQNYLGLLYAEIGEHDKAQSYYEHALATGRKVYGERHPFVADTLNNLALLYDDMPTPIGRSRCISKRLISTARRWAKPTPIMRRAHQ